MNNNLLKQPIELQKNIYKFLNLYKLKKLNEVCVELNNNIDIKVQIINLKLIKEINIINDWYLHSYESKILRNIVKKLYNNEDINKETYKKLNTDSVYDFDKSIGWGLSIITIPNIWRKIYNSRDINWSYEERNFLRDY